MIWCAKCEREVYPMHQLVAATGRVVPVCPSCGSAIAPPAAEAVVSAPKPAPKAAPLTWESRGEIRMASAPPADAEPAAPLDFIAQVRARRDALNIEIAALRRLERERDKLNAMLAAADALDELDEHTGGDAAAVQ